MGPEAKVAILLKVIFFVTNQNYTDRKFQMFACKAQSAYFV